jgi:hypothetical protein
MEFERLVCGLLRLLAEAAERDHGLGEPLDFEIGRVIVGRLSCVPDQVKVIHGLFATYLQYDGAYWVSRRGANYSHYGLKPILNCKRCAADRNPLANNKAPAILRAIATDAGRLRTYHGFGQQLPRDTGLFDGSQREHRIVFTRKVGIFTETTVN